MQRSLHMLFISSFLLVMPLTGSANAYSPLETMMAQPQTTLSEKEKIEALIHSIEKLENARFYRNGSTYGAKEAADHLRMKVDRAGRYITTAEDFIDKIATASSISGKPYKIIYDDGREVASSKFLKDQLEKLD